MKKGKNLLRFAASLSALVLLSSCNRGTGCPSNFKVADLSDGLSWLLVILPW
jgi:hypothetical protein